MILRSASTGAPAGDGEVQTPARQRWQLVLACAAEASLGGRELADAWDAAIGASGLPLQRSAGRPRPRVAQGPPLPFGMAGERELAEIVLTEVLPIWRVREALIGRLPHGWRLVDLYDVWLGLPALAARATGAVYRVVVQGDLDADRVAEVAAAAMAAEHLPRLRVKSGVEVEYDLRPLLAEVGVLLPGPPIVLGIRTRISPDLGHGRPEEVLATIADHLGVQLTAGSITRERLLLVDD